MSFFILSTRRMTLWLLWLEWVMKISFMINQGITTGHIHDQVDQHQAYIGTWYDQLWSKHVFHCFDEYATFLAS